MKITKKGVGIKRLYCIEISKWCCGEVGVNKWKGWKIKWHGREKKKSGFNVDKKNSNKKKNKQIERKRCDWERNDDADCKMIRMLITMIYERKNSQTVRKKKWKSRPRKFGKSYLVSLVNGISIFVDYLMPKLSM